MASPTIVVTGASAGIGEALAAAWASRRATLVLVGRDGDRLERTAAAVTRAGCMAVVVVADVTREEDGVRVVERARETGRLDVLCNNAGRGYYGSLASVDAAELEALFALNVVAPLRLSQLALDPLTRTGGTIVMMSSVAGVVAAPRMGAYASTKFALEAVSMSLRAELVGTGVRVVVVRPGPVDTGFRANSLTSDGTAGVRPAAAEVQTADDVAARVLRAVDAGQPVLNTSRFVRGASMTARFAPALLRWMSAAMAARGD